MEWRFTLIDRYNNRTVIEEPVGWTDFSIRIKRHPERHGTFRELQGNSFQFHGQAERLLKQEYEQYGINGNYRLLIEWKCSGGWAEFYIGTVSFDTYEHNCGTECYVQADIEQTGPVVSFINRFDQKVDVNHAVAFDQTTALTAYTHLSKIITLPSKTIHWRGRSTNKEDNEYSISSDSGWFPIAGTGRLDGFITPCFTETELKYQDYREQKTIDYYNYSNYNEVPNEILLFDTDSKLQCMMDTFINVRIKGVYKHHCGGSGNHTLSCVIKKGTNFTDNNNPVIASSIIVGPNLLTSYGDYPFDFVFTGSTTLLGGEKIWVYFTLIYFKATDFLTDVSLKIDQETFISIYTESKCDDTLAKVYLLNETMSRITEAITNNQLKVYSEYFGRKDSQPYSFTSPGCGGLRCLTTGLDIRRSKLGDGSDPKLFLSMADVFNHIAATDAVGIGVEGTDKIRVEPWMWFYKNDIILTCTDVNSVKKAIATERIYSTFKIGYDKWETEDYNGQDEILTSRTYRTQITSVQNNFEQVSKIIASGYAIETTRRKGPEDKDWRYDNDVFAICLMNKVSAATSQFIAATKFIRIPLTKLYPVGFQTHTITITGSALNDGNYTVVSVSEILGDTLIEVAEAIINETGAAIVIEDISSHYGVETGIITSAANMIDPATVYNYRISPVRMAMKWFSRVMSFLKSISSSDKLIFTAAEGNFIAKGQISEPICRMETVVMEENADINISHFEEEAENTPEMVAENVEFKYPLSAADFKKVIASPYGLTAWKSGCESGHGWLDELTYYPASGEAKFKLLSKITA